MPTTQRNLRIDDNDWGDAQAWAEAEGRPGGVSEVLRGLLRGWLATKPTRRPGRVVKGFRAATTHDPARFARDLARGGDPFAVMWDRKETDHCERGTFGCCVWHAAEDLAAGGYDGCNTW